MRKGQLPRGLDVDAAVTLLTAASFGLAWIHGVLPSAEAHEAALARLPISVKGRAVVPRGSSSSDRN